MVMVDRCINQSCSTPFRYLRNGGLFRLEDDPLVKASKPSPQYYWLCDDCSRKMNLRITKDGEVAPVSLQGQTMLDRKGITQVDRRDGLLLTRLNFLTENKAQAQYSQAK